MQNLGLATEYKQNESFRLHVRMCAALSHIIAPAEVDDGWLRIQEEVLQHAGLQQFFDYFVDYWSENTVITVDM